MTKPKPIDHPGFGVLHWDDDFDRYSFRAGEGDEAFELGFAEKDSQLLHELLDAAADLWRQKDDWFINWRKVCFDYYIAELKEAWYEGEEPLDEDTFNAKLGQPAGIDFSFEDGELQYLITGLNDDLVGDHGLEAHGTGLVPHVVCLT